MLNFFSKNQARYAYKNINQFRLKNIFSDPAFQVAKRLRRALLYLMVGSCILSAGALIVSIRFYTQVGNACFRW